MISLEERNRQKKWKEQQQKIAAKMRFRQSMRELEAGKTHTKAVIEDYSRQAVEAERSGDHEQALRIAGCVRQLKQYEKASGTIGSSLKVAYGMQTAHQAVLDLLEAQGGLADLASGQVDPAQFGRMQAEMGTVSEQMQMLMEQNQMMMELFEEPAQGEAKEEEEEFLKQIMQRTESTRKTKMLKETDRQLDRLNKMRAAGGNAK